MKEGERNGILEQQKHERLQSHSKIYSLNHRLDSYLSKNLFLYFILSTVFYARPSESSLHSIFD
jgi:hypothetical protein